MDIMDKIYLGDAVYAEFDGHDITLTTEDGINTTNTIILEPTVVDAFVEYLETLRKDLN